MKYKIKIESKEALEELIKDYKQLGYKYTIGASSNVTWLLLDDLTKKMRFEYGDDCYPDHKCITGMVKEIKEPKMVINASIEVFAPDVKPRVSEDDPTFTVDVFTVDEDGLTNLGYYCFKTNSWQFHTDTLSDYNSGEIKWVWYYPPISKEILNK